MTYRFPEQLRFRHLAVGETFRLLPDDGRWYDQPLPGTYQKISPRRCVPCDAHWGGLKLRVTVAPNAPRLAIAARSPVRSGID
jgi:hypothetical protein